LKTRKKNITSKELKQTEGVFLSLSSWGVVEAQSLDGSILNSSALVAKIRSAYWQTVRTETGLG
jgi:branched-subunit amino acid aminotransferase/4-amino-4-deoxychorismate lyase